jgi:hypothetical protein
MKKCLLIISFVFICGFSFGSNNFLTMSFDPETTLPDTTKINIYELQSLKLYPNPANDFLLIDYDVVFLKEAKVKIYNSIGAVVYTKILEEKRDKIKVSVSELDNGLYFCSLQIDGKLLNTKKVLINHR